MKSWGITCALLTGIAFAGSANADAFTDYLGESANTFLTGLNGVITMPMDPVVGGATPVDELESVPVVGHIFGVIQGTMLGLYRVTTGALDMVFAPLPMVTLSPEPRYTVIPGFEHEDF